MSLSRVRTRSYSKKGDCIIACGSNKHPMLLLRMLSSRRIWGRESLELTVLLVGKRCQHHINCFVDSGNIFEGLDRPELRRATGQYCANGRTLNTLDYIIYVYTSFICLKYLSLRSYLLT